MVSRPTLKAEAVFNPSGRTLMRVNMSVGQEEVEKTLTVDEFIELLTNSTVKERTIRIGKLPKGFYNGYLGDKESVCIVTVPAEERQFCLLGIPMRIPFPALLFCFRVTRANGVINSRHCFALDTDTPTDDSLLYRYPFGNVNCRGGICFGNIMLPPVKDFSDLDLVVDEFFAGVTNNDYYGINSSNRSGKDQGNLASALKKRKSFPLKWLTPMGMTVGDLLKNNE